MIISKTKLKDVLKIKLDPFKDFRGKYLEIYNSNLFKKLKKRLNLFKMIFRYQKKNVLRGIHGDFRTWKLITCLEGEFILLVVNNLKNHKDFKKYQFFNLSDKNNIQILVPPGFGNAHYVKTKKAIFHYKQSTLYNRKSQFTINWQDPNYNFKWPKNIKPLMSERDSLI